MRNHSLNCVRTRLVGVAVLATAILTRNCAVWAAALASDIHQTISTVSTNAGNAGEATVHGNEQYASTKLAVSNSHGATTAEDPTSAVLFDYHSVDFDSLQTHLAESIGLAKKATARGDTKPLRQRGRSRHADHHRKLQSACSSGDSFTVTSSLIPDAEGCYFGVTTSSGVLYYAGAYFYMFPLTLSSTSSNAVDIWALVYDATSLASDTPVCFASQTVHPAEASPWSCYVLTSSGSDLVEVSATEFSTSCGCDSSSSVPAPTSPAPTPEPTPAQTLAPTPIETPEPTTEDTLPPTSGVTPAPSSGYTPEPTTKETPGPAAAATPYPVTPSPVEVSTPAPETTRDPAAAPTVSPTPLTRDLPTSTSAPTEIRGDGDMSPAPVDIGPSDSGETPSPSSPTSGVVSCPVGEDFSIASPSVPDMEGCYYGVDVTSSDLMLFSQTGTEDVGQYIVIDFGDDTEFWTIMYWEGSTDTNLNITCFSSDLTNDAHPVDASWECDFEGTEDYVAVSASELSLECGCTMNSTPVPAPTAQNPPSAPVADTTRAPIPQNEPSAPVDDTTPSPQNAPSASLNDANAARKSDATVAFVCAVAGTIVSSALVIITGFIAS